MSGTMDDVFNALAFESYEKIDDTVLGPLRSMFEGRDIAEIGAMPVYQLTAEITSRRENAGMPDGVLSREIARDLLAYMREMEFVRPAPTTAAPIPTEIKLVQDKSPADMNLRELLMLLNADPGRYGELISYILEDRQVLEAELRSTNWAIVGDDGKLDVTLTLKRVQELIDHTIVQLRTDGRYGITLAKAFGRDERLMINPFATSLNEAAVRGPIHEGYDLGNLPEEVHLAYIWAAFRAENCKAWPDPIDPWEHIPQAFAESPSGRWHAVIEDYRAAKQNGDPSTEGLSRYMSPLVLGSRRPFGGSSVPERDEAWYQQQLENVAQSSVDVMSSTIRLSAQIVESVKSLSGTLHFDDTIVLGDVSSLSGTIRGRVWVPKGFRVYSQSGTIRASVYTRSYKDLYQKAVELGIIVED